MKKFIAMLLVAALTATVAVGGTLAYLTDRDSEANVFTVGNVSIDLTEDFEHGAELIPGVEILKVPTITNTGSNDAWVWMTVAIPAALDNLATGQEGSSANVIHWNCHGATWEGAVNQTYVDAAIARGLLPEGTTAEDIIAANTTWDVNNDVEPYVAEIDGVSYNIYTLLYNKALTPAETTLPGLFKVYLDARVDIDPEGNWYFVENGEATAINWNSNENGNPIIYVSAYAMQTEGFATVNDAYAAYQTQWGDNGSEWGTVSTPVSTADELKAALASGGNIILTNDIAVTDTVNIEVASQINLNGHNLTVSVLEAKADTKISNGTLYHGESTYPALSVSAGTLTMENVDIISENYCNIITSGSLSAAEYVGLEIWSGKCVLNDCTITVKADVKRYSNSVFGVGIYSGEFTMNGGSITIDNPGSTRVNYESALFASTDADKVITLNNVTITQTDNTYYMYAWGGNTIVNTTGVSGSWDGKVDTSYGEGTYTINYID